MKTDGKPLQLNKSRREVLLSVLIARVRRSPQEAALIDEMVTELIDNNPFKED